MSSGLDDSGARTPWTDDFLRLGVVFVGALALSWPAFYNGYPLAFQDSGWYITRILDLPSHPGRGIGYPFFASWTSFGESLWPIVAAQALVTSALVVRFADLAFACGRAGLWAAVSSLSVVVIFSGLPKYVSWIMADITTPWIFLAGGIWLLGRNPFDRVAAVSIAGFSVLTHNSHLPLLLAMVGVATIGAIVASGSIRQGLMKSRGLLAVAMGCIVWIPLATLLSGEKPSLFRGGDSIVLYRFIDSGVAVETLDAYCDERSWVSCDYRDEFARHVGKSDGWFLFRYDSPFYEKMQAWEGQEQGEIVAHAFRCCWLTILTTTLDGAWEQFWRIDSRDGLATIDVLPLQAFLTRYRWEERAGLVESRQARGDLSRIVLHPISETELHAIFVLIGIGLAIVGWRRGDRRAGVLIGFLLLFLVTNALICSFGSSIHDRYQGRIAWLLPFVDVIAAGWIAKGTKAIAPDV